MYLDLNMVVSLCFFFVEHEIFVYFIVERNKKLSELKKIIGKTFFLWNY